MNYNSKGLLTYVCPKCLKYMSIELDVSSNIRKPTSTCISSPDGDFNIIIEPTVRCKRCGCNSIRLMHTFSRVLFEMISRQYGIAIDNMSAGSVTDSIDCTNREISKSVTYSFPSVLFLNTSDNFVYLIDAIDKIIKTGDYPTIKTDINIDHTLVYSDVIDKSEVYERNHDMSNRYSNGLNDEFSSFIFALISEMYLITKKNNVENKK